MTRLYGTLFNASLLLMLLGTMTSVKAKILVNRCEGSTAGSCSQECDEDCKMSCARVTPPLKSCDQVCWEGQCDMKCVAKETCHQTCDTLLNCDSVRCTTANCTQLCDEGACNLSCRARSRCKQSCNQGSCNLKCPTGDHCKQVKSGITPATFIDCSQPLYFLDANSEREGVGSGRTPPTPTLRAQFQFARGYNDLRK